MSAWKRWLPWLLQVPLALVFLVASYRKLTGDAVPVETFTQLGLGEWFRYFTGVLELLGGIGLLVPRVASLAAIGLAGVMIGAVLTHLFVIGGSAALALVFLIALLAIPPMRSLVSRSAGVAGADPAARPAGLEIRPSP
jgi:putative oxidoreductase